MTRETRIALLVGLVFIVLFGLVLGQRSMNLSGSARADQSAAASSTVSSRPAPEVVTACLSESTDRNDRPALSRERRFPRLLASSGSPGLSGGNDGESGVSAPPAGSAPPSQVPGRSTPTGGAVKPQATPRQRTYRVQAGDTLIKIARKVYGRGRENQHVLIYRANRAKLPDKATLSIGQLLVIPPLPAAEPPARRAVEPSTPRHYREVSIDALAGHIRRVRTGRTYVVRQGDNLTSIARRRMGDGSASSVRKLLKVNKDRISDPDMLAIGTRLRIPG